MQWSRKDVLRSIFLLAASEAGQQQLLQAAVKDDQKARRLTIVDLLFTSLKLAAGDGDRELIRMIEETLLHFSFNEVATNLMRKCEGLVAALQALGDSGAENIIFVLDGKVAKKTEISRPAIDLLAADASGVEVESRLAESTELSEVDDDAAGNSKQIDSTVKMMHTIPDNYHAPSSVTGVEHAHVMISYCWAQQDLIIALCSCLKDVGIRYWLDVEQMHGNVTDRMAEAIETSCAVLVAASSNYKLSANCRMEAEYSMAQKKPIIPLLAEDNYKADGWLGLMISGKLYYNISSPNYLIKNLDSLLFALTPIVRASVAVSSALFESPTTDIDNTRAISTTIQANATQQPTQSTVATTATTVSAGSTSDGHVQPALAPSLPGDLDRLVNLIEGKIRELLIENLSPISDSLERLERRLEVIEDKISK